jgi:hypothetical protein
MVPALASRERPALKYGLLTTGVWISTLRQEPPFPHGRFAPCKLGLELLRRCCFYHRSHTLSARHLH